MYSSRRCHFRVTMTSMFTEAPSGQAQQPPHPEPACHEMMTGSVILITPLAQKKSEQAMFGFYGGCVIQS